MRKWSADVGVEGDYWMRHACAQTYLHSIPSDLLCFIYDVIGIGRDTSLSVALAVVQEPLGYEFRYYPKKRVSFTLYLSIHFCFYFRQSHYYRRACCCLQHSIIYDTKDHVLYGCIAAIVFQIINSFIYIYIFPHNSF